jgi:hypothetical protein
MKYGKQLNRDFKIVLYDKYRNILGIIALKT